MERYTQKQLKNLVKIGAAVDLTHVSNRSAAPGGLRKIGYAAGLYGCNGMLLQDQTGKLYAITARTTAIFLF